jgi:hypothetical protein
MSDSALIFIYRSDNTSCKESYLEKHFDEYKLRIISRQVIM